MASDVRTADYSSKDESDLPFDSSLAITRCFAADVHHPASPVVSRQRLTCCCYIVQRQTARSGQTRQLSLPTDTEVVFHANSNDIYHVGF